MRHPIIDAPDSLHVKERRKVVNVDTGILRDDIMYDALRPPEQITSRLRRLPWVSITVVRLVRIRRRILTSHSY